MWRSEDTEYTLKNKIISDQKRNTAKVQLCFDCRQGQVSEALVPAQTALYQARLTFWDLNCFDYGAKTWANAWKWTRAIMSQTPTARGVWRMWSSLQECKCFVYSQNTNRNVFQLCAKLKRTSLSFLVWFTIGFNLELINTIHKK